MVLIAQIHCSGSSWHRSQQAIHKLEIARIHHAPATPPPLYEREGVMGASYAGSVPARVFPLPQQLPAGDMWVISGPFVHLSVPKGGERGRESALQYQLWPCPLGIMLLHAAWIRQTPVLWPVSLYCAVLLSRDLWWYFIKLIVLSHWRIKLSEVV